jgi:hypothetical protein
MNFVLISMLTFGLNTAEAHGKNHARAHAHKPHPRAVVVKRHQHSGLSVGWTWVNGHWSAGVWISGFWKHPTYGQSYRGKWIGPPPRRPHVKAHWVPGHWEMRRHRRVWVNGHWAG